MNPIAPAVRSKVDAFASSFANAEPFRHVVIEDFLDPGLAQRLLADFPSFEARFALNEMGQVGGKAVREHVRDLAPPYRELDAAIQSPAFLDFVSRVTGIPDLLYDEHYVGGGTHENVQGQSLDPHVDFNYHPGTKTHRRLNLIVYLNPEWDDAWGGTLELHSDPWQAATNRIRRVTPLMNRCVIFETNEVSWHGFEAIQLPEDKRHLTRKSFAIYLYTRERPAAETAPPHATIYVPAGMPADLAAGTALAPPQVEQLRQRFDHLRTQLRFLYQREQHFNRQIQGLEHMLRETTAALRVPLQGHATQESAPTGYWHDGWIAAEFSFGFTPTQKAKTLVLDAWAPSQLPADQELTVQVGDMRTQERIAPGKRRRISVRLGSSSPMRVRITSARSWEPSADGSSGDDRGLCWRLLGATLE